MGLDMYLVGKRYLFNDPENQEKIKEIMKTKYELTAVLEELAYWRKANAIHNWFVKNVQDGRDDCQQAYVSRSQLADLSSICKQVLAARNTENANEIAAKLLPTTSGFFFGNPADDYYKQQDLAFVQQARAEIFTGLKVFYNSSW